MYRNIYKISPLFSSFVLILFLSVEVASAQAPAALNIVDRSALHVYCSLSKIIAKEKREKCDSFKNYENNKSPNFQNSNSQNQNNDLSRNLEIIDQKIIKNNQDIEFIKNKIETGTSERNTNLDLKLSELKKDLGKYTVKETGNYSNKKTSNSGDYSFGNTNINPKYLEYYRKAEQYYEGNTVVAKNSNAFGKLNTIAIDAPNAYVLGSKIVNVTPGSVQIGSSNNSKLFIAKDGFVGVGSSQNGGARTSRIADEQLRVAGRIRAHGFDIDSAADLSENFPVDGKNILAGHIVQLSNIMHPWKAGGEDEKVYELSGIEKAKERDLSIGVIATNPGIILGNNTDGLPVAFSGRVPVIINNENGNIKKGDNITLSLKENGVGVKLTGSGKSIGIALADQKEGENKILVLVKNEYIQAKSK